MYPYSLEPWCRAINFAVLDIIVRMIQFLKVNALKLPVVGCSKSCLDD